MADKLDCVVVGAGVIGLAIGRTLALAGREVMVLEAESRIGMHSSSRNSEVIHAGIYYAEESLKARFCVQGKDMLYRYCEAHHVAHKRIGKLIVAADRDDIEKLQAIARQAQRNGVDDLRFLDESEVNELEPAVICHGAQLSPSTGIVDTHELMTAFEAELEANGGAVVLNSQVSNLHVIAGGLQFDSGGQTFVCNELVNAAGLWAQELVAKSRSNSRPKALPRRYLAKGHYFAYQGESPFEHLIYPVPSAGGLGIHATNDLGGAVRFGPNVSWVDEIDYDFDEGLKPDFVEAIRRYFPGLDEEKLVPAYTGIRPKISGPGEPPADFMIQDEKDHGVPGLVNLFGIESPGLTASLAIGEYVSDLLGTQSIAHRRS